MVYFYLVLIVFKLDQNYKLQYSGGDQLVCTKLNEVVWLDLE